MREYKITAYSIGLKGGKRTWKCNYYDLDCGYLILTWIDKKTRLPVKIKIYNAKMFTRIKVKILKEGTI